MTAFRRSFPHACVLLMRREMHHTSSPSPFLFGPRSWKENRYRSIFQVRVSLSFIYFSDLLLATAISGGSKGDTPRVVPNAKVLPRP